MSQTTFPATQIAALAPDDSTRLFSGPFLVLNLSALFSAVSFSSMLPLTALLVTDQTGGGDVAVGFAIGVFAITAIAARPLIGHLGESREWAEIEHRDETLDCVPVAVPIVDRARAPA